MGEGGESSKIPYRESQTKRFEIKNDGFSRERARAALDVKDRVEVELGIPVGCTLMGSLTKGKELTSATAPYSDIDAAFYVDSEKLKEERDRIFGDQGSEFGKFCDEMRRGYEKDPVEVYRHLMWGRYFGSLEEAPNRPLTDLDYIEGYIQKTMKDMLGEKQQELGLPEENMADIFVIPISMEGENSIMAMVDRLRHTQLTQDEHDYLTFAVGHIFGLDLGGGMKKYRRTFIDTVDRFGTQEGDAAWYQVKSCIEDYERMEEIPEEIRSQFPQNFYQARDYYAPHETRNRYKKTA